ncbi:MULTISPECIES: DUF6233 domain-containing protein [unclassified Streptomyces]|uniref:DUF6233 domain-containing protein n=1 Tax=unclassified Streptomyces TaxID=2593676 RepID=UPI003D90C496
MNELPPDPARLRVILAWLEEQVTDNETVGIFLRLQRDTVAQALAQAAESEQPATPPPAPPAPPAKPPRPTSLPTFTGDHRPAFKVVEQGGENEPARLTLHIGACDVDDGPAHQVDAHDALAALREGLDACSVCRPDIDLSFDE